MYFGGEMRLIGEGKWSDFRYVRAAQDSSIGGIWVYVSPRNGVSSINPFFIEPGMQYLLRKEVNK